MKKIVIYAPFLLLLLDNLAHAYFSIDSNPLCTVYTENSILNNREKYKPLYIGERLRYGTCSSAAWFHATYLVVLNLLGKKITIYSFNSDTKNFTKLQEITDPIARLIHPIGLAVSPDGTMLAICSDGPYQGIALYQIDTITHQINPKPIFMKKTKGLIHNITFNNTGKYLAAAGFEPNESIEIYKIDTQKREILSSVFKRVNTRPGRKTKAVKFTSDDKFIIAAYSISAQKKGHFLEKTIIHIYNFDAIKEKIESPVCEIEDAHDIDCVEDIALLPDDKAIALSDNANDSVIIYPFNGETGQLNATYEVIKGPETNFSFPHGLALSPDNNFLIVTNYGNDSFSLYQVVQKG